MHPKDGIVLPKGTEWEPTQIPAPGVGVWYLVPDALGPVMLAWRGVCWGGRHGLVLAVSPLVGMQCRQASPSSFTGRRPVSFLLRLPRSRTRLRHAGLLFGGPMCGAVVVGLGVLLLFRREANWERHVLLSTPQITL